MKKFLFFIIFILLYHFALPQKHKVLNAKVTYYSKKFDGRRTYSGEKFNSNKFTAAHRSFPLQSLVKVTNPKNNNYVIVRINDRFRKKNYIDISYIAAKNLDIIRHGTGYVKIQRLDTSFMQEYLSQSVNDKLTDKDNITSNLESDTNKTYYIRLISYKLKKNAELFIESKLRKEYRSYAIIKKTSYKRKPLYKVLVGPFKTKAEADETLKLAHKRYKDATILQY